MEPINGVDLEPLNDAPVEELELPVMAELAGKALRELHAREPFVLAGDPTGLGPLRDVLGAADRERAQDDARRRFRGDVQRAGDAFAKGKHNDTLEAARAALARSSSLAAPPRTFTALDALRRKEDIPFLCRPLQIAPGRPPCLVGYAGAGKTTMAMSCAIAWAIDRPALGSIEAARVPRVVLVDLDTGVDAALHRMREVLRAEGIGEGDLKGATVDVIDGKRRGLRLTCSLRPDLPSDADEAAYFNAWSAVLAEYDLAIVDNLRKLGPRLNLDNDPRAAVVLDLLGEASSETGGIPWVMAHAPKGRDRGPYQAIKGKADLEGTAGAIQVLWLDDDQRRHLELTRPVELHWQPLLGYVDLGDNGLVFSSDSAAAKLVTGAKPKPAGPKLDSRGSADVGFARDVLKAHPGIHGRDALVNAVCDAARNRHKKQGGPLGTARAEAAIRALRDAGEIDARKTADKQPRPRWYWKDPSAPAPGSPEAKQVALDEALTAGPPSDEA